MPMKQIARRLRVSVGSVHLWTSDIELADQYRVRNREAGRKVAARRWTEINRQRRLAFQAEGPERRRGSTIRFMEPAACCTGRRAQRTEASSPSRTRIARWLRSFGDF